MPPTKGCRDDLPVSVNPETGRPNCPGRRIIDNLNNSGTSLFCVIYDRLIAAGHSPQTTRGTSA